MRFSTLLRKAFLFAFFTLTIPQISFALDSLTVEGFTVDDDNNGLSDSQGNDNGLAEYGEIIELILDIKSHGGAASGVTVLLSTTDPDINITDNTVLIAGIGNGATEEARDFVFEIDSQFVERDVTFQVEIQHSGTSYFDQVVLHIIGFPPSLSMSAGAVDDDNTGASSGDGDGLMEPGETIQFSASALNSGGQSITGAVARLTSRTGNIIFSDSIESYGTLNPNAAVTRSGYVFTVKAGISSVVDTVDFLIASNSGNFTGFFTFQLEGGPPILTAEGAVVDDDSFGASNGNDNGLVESGETVELALQYKNVGGSIATGIQAIMVSLDPDVTVPDNDAFLPDIAAGQTQTATSKFDIVVGNITTVKNVGFEITFTSNEGTFVDTFYLEVRGFANLSYHSTVLNDDVFGLSQGNGNGQANAGETIEVFIRMRNDGGDTARNVHLGLSSSNSGITFLEDSSFQAAIAPGAVVEFTGFLMDVGIGVENSTATIDVEVESQTENKTLDFNINLFGTVVMNFDTLQIDDDNSGSSSGNANGQAEAGETLELLLTLKNRGGNTATGVSAKIRCSDSLITITDSVKTVSSVSGGSSALIGSDFDLIVAEEAVTSQIPIQLEITTDQGVFIDTFNLNVTGVPNLVANEMLVDDDNLGASSGDGDGVSKAGEIIELSLVSENNGGEAVSNLYAKLTTSSPDYPLQSDSLFIGNLASKAIDTTNGLIASPSANLISGNVVITIQYFATEGTWVEQVTIPVLGIPNVVVDTIYLSDDSNGGSNGDGDGIVEGGESVEAQIELENIGGGDANNLTVKLSTTNPLITITDSVKTTSGVEKLDKKLIASDFDFNVDIDAPSQTVTFRVDITGDEGSWTDFYNIDIVGSPKLSYLSNSIDDDAIAPSSGNGNGIIDASESIELDLSIQNLGQNTATNTSMVISTSQSGVNIIADSAFLGNITVGANATGFDYFLTVDTLFADENLVLDLTVYSDQATFTDQVSIPVAGLIDPRFVGFVLSDDAFGGSNGDGDTIAEAGEIVEINLVVRNFGGGTLNNIEAEISTTDPAISLIDSIKSISRIRGLETYTISSDYDFEIDPSVPDKTIAFNLELRGDEGNFNVPFLFDVKGKAILTIGGSQISDDNIGQSFGDGDLIAEAGEIIELDLNLKNIGGVAANNVSVSISTTDSLLTLHADTTVLFSPVPGLDSTLAGTFEIELDQSITDRTVPLTVKIYSDAGMVTEVIDFELKGVPDLYVGGFSIDDDNFGSSRGDSNLAVDAGESIELILSLLNLGGSRANNIEVELTSSSPFITMTDSVKTLSSVSSQSVRTITSDFDFDVDPNAPSGIATFNVKITSDEATWFRTLGVPITGVPVLEVLNTSYLGLGNLDTVADAGEAVSLDFELTNSGTEPGDSVYAILTSLDTLATVTQNAVLIGTVNVDDTLSITGHQFFVDIDSRTTTIDFLLEMFSGSKSWTTEVEVPVLGRVELAFADVRIDDDQNGDSFGNSDTIVNSGESIEFYVSLQNFGGGRANNVTAVVSTQDPDIQITDGSKYTATVNGHAVKEISSDFDFDVAPLTPSKDVWFYVDIASDEGSWLDSFKLAVVGAPILNYVASVVNDDNLGLSVGNNNGILDAGETVELAVSISNLGPAIGTNIYGSIATSNPSFTILQDSIFFGNILPGDTLNAGFAVVQIDSNVIEQATDFTISLVSDQITVTRTFELTPNGLIDLGFVSTMIDDDNIGSSIGNGDSMADAGESVELYIEIANSLGGVAQNVLGVISTNHPSITITDDNKTFPSLASFDTAFFSSDFDFDVAANAPNDTAWFYLNLSSEGQTWLDSFAIKINAKPVFNVDQVFIDDDNSNASSGDNDQLAEAGETVELAVQVTNVGLLDAFNITSSISVNHPMVTLLDGTGNFTDSLRVGVTGMMDGFTVQIDSAATYQLVPCTLHLATAQGNFSRVFELRINGFVDLKIDSFLISDDPFSGSNGNGNGWINGGESIELQPYIHNLGPGRARFVTAELKTDDPDITLTDSIIAVTDISAGAIRLTSSDFDFKVHDDASAHIAEFTIETQTSSGFFVDTIYLEIFEGSALVNLDSIIFNDDMFSGSYGDGDGKFEAGESIEMQFRINNLGTKSLEDLKASINSATPGITITDSNFVVSNIDGFTTVTPASDVDFDIDPGMQTGTAVFRISLKNDAVSFDTIVSVQVYRASEIKVEVNPDSVGCVATGAGFYDPLEQVSLVAEDCPGHVFLEWQEHGKTVSTAKTLIVTTGSGGTVTALYREYGVGVEEEPINVLAYPNPFTGRLSIELTGIQGQEDLAIRVYNNIGQVMLSDQNVTASEKLDYDTSNWPAGLYIVEIEVNGLPKRLKLVKSE